MINYKKVKCNILKCTEFEHKEVKSSSKTHGDVVFRSFEDTCHYDGKVLKKNVAFLELDSPFHNVYVPEEKYNIFTKFIINFCRSYLHKLTFDEKRFYTTSPFEVGDIFVENVEN